MNLVKLSIFILISFLAYFSFSTLSGKSIIELNIGDQAPLFSLKDQDKRVHNLSDYLGQRVVIYYFPKADTPGWTIQACGFRDIYDKYEKSNIVVFGISYDSSRSLRKFKKKWKNRFCPFWPKYGMFGHRDRHGWTRTKISSRLD